MKQLSIRLADDLHAALASLAEDEERSLNNQIVYLLRQTPQVRDRMTKLGLQPAPDAPPPA